MVRALATEVLVYECEWHEAHRLNQSAALAWEQCDGVTAPA